MPASEAEALTPAVNPVVTDTVPEVPQQSVLLGVSFQKPQGFQHQKLVGLDELGGLEL